MTILLPYAVFLAAAFSLFVVFGFKSVESLFVTLCSAMVLMFAFALFSAITPGVYAIAAIAAALFIYAVVFIIRKKLGIINLIKDFLSPAFAALSVSVLIFTALTVNVRLIAWDDATHWGLAVKVLYTLGGFPKEAGILGPQTNALPLLNCFIVKLAGYKEGFMLSGLWLFTWTCFMLPLSHMKWNKYKAVAIFSVFCYSVIILTRPADALSLRMDAALGIMSGSLAAYYLLNRKDNKNVFFSVVAGLFILALTKRVFGMVMAFFVISVIAWSLAAEAKNNNLKFFTRKNVFRLSACILAPAIAYILHLFSQKGNAQEAKLAAPGWNYLFGSIKASFLSGPGIAIILAAAAFALWFIYSAHKKKKSALPAVVLLVISCFAMLAYIYFGLDSGSKIFINAYLKNLLATKIFGFDGYKLFGVTFIIYFAFLFLGIGQKYKKQYAGLGVLFAAHFLLYLAFLLASYSFFSEYEALKSAGLDRYLSSFVIYALLPFVTILLVPAPVWQNRKAYYKFAASVALVSVLIFPEPLYIYNYQKTSPFESSLLGGVEYHSNMIAAGTDENAKVYLIAQKDSGLIAHWTKYNIFPRKVNTLASSIGPKKQEDDIWSVDYSKQEWEKALIDDGYTHLYIVDIDDYFVETFKGMFAPGAPVQSEILYEITKDAGGNIVFAPAPG